MTLALVIGLLAAQDRPKDKPVTGMEVGDVVQWIAKNSKVKLILAESILPKERRVAVSAELLDPAFAFENGLKLLKSVDIAAVATDLPGTFELVPAPIASKKVGRVFTSVDDLPKHEEFCTLSLRLKHQSPRNAQALLINLATFPQNCLAEESSGSLVLSDFTSNLRRMAELARQVDVPPPPSAYRLTVAVLEASKDGAADVPDEFKALDLPKSTGFARFKRVGETAARFEVGQGHTKAGAAEAVLRIAGPPPVRFELGGSDRTREGLLIERFAAFLDGTPGTLSLQTRIEFRGDGWVLVGLAPGENQLTALVILARAVSEK